MTPFTQITARDWQLALGPPGDVVTDLGDIGQCIRTILTTPKGSDPLRPDFACDLWRYLDRPISQAGPHIVRDAWAAITAFEPRIELISIAPRLGDDPGQLVVRIEWRRAEQGALQTTEVAV